VLVEGGFLNNPREAKKLAQPAYRERLATAIAEGVAAYQREREADAQVEKRTKS
jgi:N-acetylmuramoyl-L-alanine amidase